MRTTAGESSRTSRRAPAPRPGRAPGRGIPRRATCPKNGTVKACAGDLIRHSFKVVYGALLRREGLYSSHLTTWRAALGLPRATYYRRRRPRPCRHHRAARV